MTDILNYSDYRDYLKNWIASQPSKGLQSRLAEAAQISSTHMSRILSGQKDLTPEQGLALAGFLGLSSNRLDYFLLLIEKERAGTWALQEHYKKRVQEFSTLVKNRLNGKIELDEKVKSIFYSSWIYGAVRTLAACPGPHDVESIAHQLGLKKQVVADALEFLASAGLVSHGPQGYAYASKSTHLSSESPLINQHHRNWRTRAIEMMEEKNPEALHFSGPMSMSLETAQEVKKKLLTAIDDVLATVGPSESEVTFAMNIDWFNFSKN